MGEEVKVWAALIGNFGLPIVFVLWYFIIDRPAQRRREEDIEKRSYERMAQSLVDRDKVFESTRNSDRQHQMEIAKLQGEIHLSATREMTSAIGKNTEEVERLTDSLGKALEEFRRGPPKRP